MHSKDIKGICAVVILSLAFLGFFYSKFLIHPNDHLFSDSADGLKAYYVYQYHVDNDSSWTQTKSINYPYGESHVYTDGQIFIANIFKLLKSFIPGISKYALGFTNELILISYIFSGVLLFLILRKLRLPVNYSVLGALSISILSPQVFRILGHLSLAYCFFVPLVWYLFIRFHESVHKWRSTFLIISVLSISPFIHGYYLLIGTLFIACLWLIMSFQNPLRFIKSEKCWLHFLLQVALPSLLFQTYMHFFDQHTGRTTEPYGMLIYTANLTTVFIPTQGPFYYLASYFHNFEFQEWEGWAYIGTPMLIVLAYAFLKNGRYLIRKRIKLIFRPALPFILRPALWASVIILFYSFGYPFKAHMMFLLDWFPFLKQFRSLGRFAWVFYYVFAVYGMYLFYLFIRLLRQKKLKSLAYHFQFWFFLILFIDGFAQHQKVLTMISRSQNIFKLGQLDEKMIRSIQAVERNKYQAIFPLPFYHIGSEAQTLEGSNATQKVSMIMAYHLDLPLIACNSARTSQTESGKVVQLLSPVSFRKEAMARFKNRKPMLITCTRENMNANENSLLARAVKLYSNDQLDLYELSYDSLFKYSGDEEIASFESNRMNYLPKGDLLVHDTVGLVFHNTYDKTASEKTYSGAGGFQGNMKDYNFFVKDTLLPFDPAKEYEVSFWYYNRGVFINNMLLYVQEKSPDLKNAEVIAFQKVAECSNISGDWSLLNLKFKLKSKGDKISISIKGGEDRDLKIFADEFLIRAVDEDVYKIIEERDGRIRKLMKNNITLTMSN